MQIGQVLLILFAFVFVAVQSSKVIYVNFGKDHHRYIETLESGIIIVPGEKPKCKDGRTPDRNGHCRRIVEF
jgi:hypothetical protein